MLRNPGLSSRSYKICLMVIICPPTNSTVVGVLLFRRHLWFSYADLLVLAGEYEQARPICEQVIEVIEVNNQPHSLNVLDFSRIHISLVYKELDVEPETLQRLLS